MKHRVVAALAALVASGCAAVSTGPVIVPPPPPTFTLAVHVFRGDPAEDHKVPGAAIGIDNCAQPRCNTIADAAGNGNLTGLAPGPYLFCASAPGYERACAPVTIPVPGLDLSLVRSVAPALPVRVDGRFFVTDAGTFRPLFQSGLALLARGPPERDAFLDQTRALGFNGIRVFAGDLGWAGQTPDSARAALPGLLDAAAERGLYVYVCAITGGKSPVYDIEAHLRAIVAIVQGRPNVLLEVANEIGHPTLSDTANDIPRLLSIARRVIPAGVTWTLGAPLGTDEPTPEGTYPTDGGAFNDAHLDRGRDLYNQVRRLREIYGIAESTRKPSMSGEPIGIAEVPMPGKQRFWNGTDGDTVRRFSVTDAATRFSFALGVLCRGFEIGCVFHSEQGLQGQPLGPNTREAAGEFLAGWKAIPTTERLSFVNAGWQGSPVAGADFDNGIVRAYSFVAGARGWTVLVGVRGDPRVVWGGGWRPVGVIAERPGLQVLEISR